MGKHTFKETTAIANKVFFAGDAEISDEDAKTLKPSQAPTTETSSADGGETDLTKKTKAELMKMAGDRADESMTKAQIIELIEG